MTDPQLSLESRMKLHDIRNHVHLYAGRWHVTRILRDRLDQILLRSLRLLEGGRGAADVMGALQEGRQMLEELSDHDRSMELAFDRIVGIVLSSYDPGHVQVFSLAKLVGDEVAYFHSDLRRLPADRLTFSAHFDPHVRADPERLRRMVDNLIMNAADALLDDTGEIHVEVDVHAVLKPRKGIGGDIEAGNYGTVTVRDDGRGLDPSQLDRVFLAGVSSKTDHPGLGLAYVKQVVDESTGGLEVAPVKPHGTVFRVYLPLEVAAGEPANGGEAGTGAAGTGGASTGA